jgi:phospholipid/cholesterol/gamma-HCH transport system substrate-binding protein
MSEYKKNEIKVGIVSAVAIIMLIGIIIYIKGAAFSSDSQTILFIFDNSLGISSGSPVVVNGVKRGAVQDVWNNGDGVYVKASVSDISDIKSDASAMITILELTGGKKIEINPGSSQTLYDPSEPIRGLHSTDLQTMLNELGGITSNLVSVVVNLDTLLTKTNAALNDTMLTNQFSSILRNTENVVNNLNTILVSNGQNIQQTTNNLVALSNDLKNVLDTNEVQINSIIRSADTLLNNLKRSVPQVDTTLIEVRRIVNDVGEIIAAINSDNGGTLSKLIYDKEFAKKLDSTLVGLDSLVEHIKQYGINANVRLGGRP